MRAISALPAVWPSQHSTNAEAAFRLTLLSIIDVCVCSLMYFMVTHEVQPYEIDVGVRT